MPNTRRTVAWTMMATLVVLAGVEQSRGSLILNGDFEDNTAVATIFNMDNAMFDATVANATAFGLGEEIDLVTGLDFGMAPQSGDWKLGIHTKTNGDNDEFSLTLSMPLMAGDDYDLSFWAVNDVNPFSEGIEIGVSATAGSFGTLIYTSAAPGLDWTNFTTTFSAPIDGGFLTVRNAGAGNLYNSVDNFTLNPVPGPGGLATLAIVALRRRRQRS